MKKTWHLQIGILKIKVDHFCHLTSEVGEKAAFIEFLLYAFFSIVTFNPMSNSKRLLTLNLHEEMKATEIILVARKMMKYSNRIQPRFIQLPKLLFPLHHLAFLNYLNFVLQPTVDMPTQTSTTTTTK